MKNEIETFQRGVTHGFNGVLRNLLDESDKLTVIKALFRKAYNLAEAETDPAKKAELEAYSEGFRHTLNILKNLGPALEAYHGIINPSIKIPLTPTEVKLLAWD